MSYLKSTLLIPYGLHGIITRRSRFRRICILYLTILLLYLFLPLLGQTAHVSEEAPSFVPFGHASQLTLIPNN
jgi:hypothetical protein